MLTRIATYAAFAGRRTVPATVRYNSSSSSSTTARVVQMAAEAERPTTVEAAVPAMWVACSFFTFAAWNRISETSASENVEKLLIV